MEYNCKSSIVQHPENFSVNLDLKFRNSAMAISQTCKSENEARIILVSSLHSFLCKVMDEFIIQSADAKCPDLGGTKNFDGDPLFDYLTESYCVINGPYCIFELPLRIKERFDQLNQLIPQEVDRYQRPISSYTSRMRKTLAFIIKQSNTILALLERMNASSNAA